MQYLPGDPKDALPGFGGVYQTANLSLYAYAFHNPLRLRDADGNETVGEFIERKGVEAAGQGSNVAAFGWAFAEAAWTFFGAEHVSRLTDSVISGKQVQGSDVFWSVVDIATLGKGGGLVGAGAKYVPKAGRFLAGLTARLAPSAKGVEEGHFVYRALNEAGEVIYVGITNDIVRRAQEHLRTKGIEITKFLSGLSAYDARAVEHVLIEIHGLGKNGGTLLNEINSIAKKNPICADALKRGKEILEKIGYPMER